MTFCNKFQGICQILALMFDNQFWTRVHQHAQLEVWTEQYGLKHKNLTMRHRALNEDAYVKGYLDKAQCHLFDQRL